MLSSPPATPALANTPRTWSLTSNAPRSSDTTHPPRRARSTRPVSCLGRGRSPGTALAGYSAAACLQCHHGRSRAPIHLVALGRVVSIVGRGVRLSTMVFRRAATSRSLPRQQIRSRPHDDLAMRDPGASDQHCSRCRKSSGSTPRFGRAYPRRAAGRTWSPSRPHVEAGERAQYRDP